jgi:glycosidase
MKKFLLVAFSMLCLTSYAQQQCCQLEHPCFAYDATMYELNTRQLTEEGTFKAAEAVLPELREMGIDIIWIMPIQPIGELTRKGTLGSYYSIVDYCQFNPEFGTREDFEHFLAKAHELGFKVILDWVANHTAPDSEWTKNDGWHYRDSLGNLMVQYDWTDISKLNYENQDMRAAMKQAMHWWMDTIGIDGFRCDVAGEVPTDFWNDAMAELRVKHPKMFTLAEDEAKAQELTETAFDMYYGWELHHLMNAVAQGKKTVQDLWDYFAKVDRTIRPEAIRMNFTSNHDENSWNGTEFERLGDASNLFAAFTYIVPGMPMIYTGQPSGNHHRLEFFEKDLIDRVEGAPQKAMYTKLNQLRENNFALWSNEIGAPMVRLEADNDKVFACVRSAVCPKSNKENTVVAIMNMSDKEQTVTVTLGEHAGKYTCVCGKTKKIKSTVKLTLQPWQHIILTK